MAGKRVLPPRPTVVSLDAVKQLRKAIGSEPVDNFPNGTVIRWRSAYTYIYAAVKSPRGWFTTAASYNTFVPQVVSYPQLIKILARDETSDVEVATNWEAI